MRSFTAHSPRLGPRAGGDASARMATLVEMSIKAGAFADVDPEPSARLVFAMLHETVDAISEGRDRKRMVSALKLMLRRSLGQRSA